MNPTIIERLAFFSKQLAASMSTASRQLRCRRHAGLIKSDLRNSVSAASLLLGVEGVGLRVEGLGFRVQAVMLRVDGLGFSCLGPIANSSPQTLASTLSTIHAGLGKETHPKP